MSATRMLLRAAGLVAVATSLTACQTSGGGLFARGDGPKVVPSTETVQSSVSMVDLRSGEVFFAMDIPPGKQLVWVFEQGQGDDPVQTPDIMRFEVRDLNRNSGKLRNSMTAPGASARRVDVFVKQAVQYTPAPAEQAALRTDKLNERPDWWTPRGGAMPDEARQNLYDN